VQNYHSWLHLLLKLTNHLNSFCSLRSAQFSLRAPYHLTSFDCKSKIRYPHIPATSKTFNLVRGTTFLQIYYVTLTKSPAQDKAAHGFCSRCGVHIFRAPSPTVDVIEVRHHIKSQSNHNHNQLHTITLTHPRLRPRPHPNPPFPFHRSTYPALTMARQKQQSSTFTTTTFQTPWGKASSPALSQLSSGRPATPYPSTQPRHPRPRHYKTRGTHPSTTEKEAAALPPWPIRRTP